MGGGLLTWPVRCHRHRDGGATVTVSSVPPAWAGGLAASDVPPVIGWLAAMRVRPGSPQGGGNERTVACTASHPTTGPGWTK